MTRRGPNPLLPFDQLVRREDTLPPNWPPRMDAQTVATFERAAAGGPYRSRWPAACIVALVYAEAFLLDPAHFAKCVWWRILGKRLRARLNLAPLLGQTRHAYDLWLARQGEPRISAAPADVAGVVALVAEGQGVEATLASLAAAEIEALLLRDDSQAILAELLESGKDLWVLPIASGDLVSIDAGAAYRKAASQAPPETQVVYADDDLIDSSRRRHSPHFKPDWNAELFAHFDYLTGACIVRLGEKALPCLSVANWAEQLVADAVHCAQTAGAEAVHVSNILHHRQARPDPRLPLAPPLPASVDEHLPSISVVVPTRNRHDLLATCLDGLARTNYPRPVEIVVIDNGSDDPETLEYLAGLDPHFARVLRDEGPFNFAALNNRAVRETAGEMLCLLNNDIEVIDPHWLVPMVRQAMRAEVGAVGAQLLYPDGSIQHAGVVIGIGGGAAHAHRLLAPDDEGYFHRHKLPQFVTAVTAAALVVDRTKFEAAGGFDEERFAVSFNDVDLCLKLHAKGWQNLFEPRARLVHHESVSRGLDRDPVGAARQAGELCALQQLWGTTLVSDGETRESASPDPFHHRNLSRLSEQFVLSL